MHSCSTSIENKFKRKILAELSCRFYFRIDSPLARLYSTSTMEHHHFDHCTMILHSQASFKKHFSLDFCPRVTVWLFFVGFVHTVVIPL